MTTSGTASFNLDFAEIVEEAFERNGREMRTGYDLRTARRSMNLLLAEMANRGINLWTVEEGSIPMVTGQATYTLPVDTVDLLDHVIRTGSGQNQLRLAGVCLKLLAQAQNVDLDSIGSIGVIFTPDRLGKGSVGHRPAGVLHQAVQNDTLGMSEVYLLLII